MFAQWFSPSIRDAQVEQLELDQLRRECSVYLGSGEEVQEAFEVLGGTSLGITLCLRPGTPFGWLLGGRRYVVAATNEAVILFRHNFWMGVRKEVARFPRETRLGPVCARHGSVGPWIRLDGKSYLVVNDAHAAEARAADARQQP